MSLPFQRDLAALGQELAARYAAAEPFPHIAIDGLFPDALLDTIISEFPSPADMDEQFDAAYEVKSASSTWSKIGDTTRLFLADLNFGPFVGFLEELTGITGLVGDPFLVGGGQHQIREGGKLGIHADFNIHKGLHLDRRLNVLVYLNRGWEDAWGGHLELWDATSNTCCERILPAFNRCVIFNVSDIALHGHPDALRPPDAQTRKSLALYYYTNGRPQHELAPEHTTIFRSRPGSPDPGRLRRIAIDLTPPLLSREMSKARDRMRARAARKAAPRP